MQDGIHVSGRIVSEIPRLNPKNGTWRYAVIGGLASIPLSLGFYWLSGVGNTFSTSMIFFGGLLAGYLAQKNVRNPVTAGLGAGIIGGLPGYIWILPELTQTATAWSWPGVIALVALAIPAIIAVAALPGLTGGVVGSWVAKKVGRKQIVAISA